MRKPISKLVKEVVQAKSDRDAWEAKYKRLDARGEKSYGAWFRYNLASAEASEAYRALQRRLPCGGSVHAMKIYVGIIKDTK